MKVKKEHGIIIYRHFFRFSIEKLIEYIRDPCIMMIVINYISMTQLERIHQKPCLLKHAKCYYRCLENLINNSVFGQHVISNIQDFNQLPAEDY